MSMPMARHRPMGVTILAIFSALGALVSAYYALQYLGLIPFVLGPVSFYGQDWAGAALYALCGVMWVWVTLLLWRVDKQGWVFVVVLAGLNFLLAWVSMLGATTLGAALPTLLLNGGILAYCFTPGVRDAFGAPI
jgi:hypothetical protein